MTDKQKKYEEAAREYEGNNGDDPPSYRDVREAFVAGASFAEKEAHNAAIDKCINAFKINKGVLSFEELEKLKL